MTDNIYWHRLFGLLLIDYLSDRGFKVELEKDLSLKRQYLDVLIVESIEDEPDLSNICAGFDSLSRHNLLSYKSIHQTLNAWALEELIGHYVNYKKILDQKNIKDKDIQLYAISTRFPGKLFSQIPAKELDQGVWEVKVLSRNIRILVLSRLTREKRNAVLAFFSFDEDKVQFALDNYTWQRKDVSTVINQLLEKYALEGLGMPYTMEHFKKDYIKAHLHELDAEEVLSKFNSEERIKGLKPEEVLSKFDSEERLKGLKPEEIENYLQKIKKNRDK